MLTAPVLFARARGIEVPTGPHSCFYCGFVCGDEFPAKKFVQKTFTAVADVANPGGSFVCGGCVASMEEKTEFTMADGEIRTDKVRGYSWIVASKSTALTVKHRDAMRDACVNPPAPPFTIVLSMTGKKHLIYRAAVNLQSTSLTVQLETDRIAYSPRDLADRIDLGLAVSEAAKASLRPFSNQKMPSMMDGLNSVQLIRLAGADETLLNRWQKVAGQSLTRLALFLAPNLNKKDADDATDDVSGGDE